MKLLTVCLACLVLVFCSCNGQGSILPKSGGRPYEVLLVANGGGSVAHGLEAELMKDVPGLPQREPMFDVSLTDSAHFVAGLRLARNIVIVSVDPGLFTSVRVRYERNVWARPQVLVYVNAPSVDELNGAMPTVGRQVADLLAGSELKVEIARLNAGCNEKASEAVRKGFGYDIRIPVDMKSSKHGERFVWFSDNAASGMQNICVYSYPGLELDPVRALAMRDSVMRVNIPGERRGMYMRTAARTVMSGMSEQGGCSVMVSRGLWEMQGDAMGGPFVSRSVIDTVNRRVVVAEAFVYAPGMKKRNLMRQVEAVLHTFRKVTK